MMSQNSTRIKQDSFATCFKTCGTGSPILRCKVLRCQGWTSRQTDTRYTGLVVPLGLLEIYLVSILCSYLSFEQHVWRRKISFFDMLPNHCENLGKFGLVSILKPPSYLGLSKKATCLRDRVAAWPCGRN